MATYLEVLKKYAVFRGRAPRKEYWMFYLVSVIIALGLRLAGEMAGVSNGFAIIYQLGVLVPTIAVGVRRMHDNERVGWWLLLPVVNLVFLIQEGHHRTNRFGPDPTGPQTMTI